MTDKSNYPKIKGWIVSDGSHIRLNPSSAEFPSMYCEGGRANRDETGTIITEVKK